jgi:UDP-N-acetylglucosamine 1-carboxyvinyltransferase
MALEKIRVEGGTALHGKIKVSGAKNAALPLMTAALLADGPVYLRNVPQLADIKTMSAVLVSLGATVERKGDGLLIDGTKINNFEAPYDVVRKMRASIYVMGPLLARLGQAQVSFPGGCAIGPRPVDLHLTGMEQIGVEIKLDHGIIHACRKKMRGGEFDLSGPAGPSVGATCNVMMAATAAEGKTIIHGAACEPEVQDLADFINAMGGAVTGQGEDTMTIEGGRTLKACEYEIIPDRIEAGTYLAAAAITGGEIELKGCRPEQMTATLGTFIEIGCDLEVAGDRVRLSRSKKQLRPTSIVTKPYRGFPTDMQAQFTALLATIPGRAEVKETIYIDRFIHVAELLRMGADIHLKRGSITIRGVEKLSGAPVMASDLRASAALVLAGLKAEGETVISRVYHLDRGYERLDEKLCKLGARIERLPDTGQHTSAPQSPKSK